jgi:hypothetical protein
MTAPSGKIDPPAETAGHTILSQIHYNDPMLDMLLKTKFTIPPPRPQLVPRPRLIAELNALQMLVPAVGHSALAWEIGNKCEDSYGFCS